MYFKLAETLGMTVSELLERMSSAEITEWAAYFKLKHKEEEKELAKARSKVRRH